MLATISPGEPKSIEFLIVDNTAPLAAGAAAGLAVQAVLSATPHGPALAPALRYDAVEVGAAPIGYVGRVYRVLTGAETAVPLGPRIHDRIYLCPVVNGLPTAIRDIVELLVTP